MIAAEGKPGTDTLGRTGTFGDDNTRLPYPVGPHRLQVTTRRRPIKPGLSLGGCATDTSSTNRSDTQPNRKTPPTMELRHIGCHSRVVAKAGGVESFDSAAGVGAPSSLGTVIMIGELEPTRTIDAGIFERTVARLCVEFESTTPRRQVESVLRWSLSDLAGSPVGAMPELGERLARQRLSDGAV